MKVILKNRLPVLMQERGVRSAAALARRLKSEQAYSLSSSQATRYLKDDPPAFDLEFINAMCNVLQCLPSDLYSARIELDSTEEIDASLALPRHMEILRNTETPNKPKPDKVKPKRERADSNAPAKNVKKKDDPPEISGPSAQIFPFTKQ